MDKSVLATELSVVVVACALAVMAAPRQCIEILAAIARYMKERWSPEHPEHEGMGSSDVLCTMRRVFDLLVAAAVIAILVFAAGKARAAEPALRLAHLQPKLVGAQEAFLTVGPGQGCVQATGGMLTIEECAWMGYDIGRKPRRNSRGLIEAPPLYPGDVIVYRRETYSNGQILQSWYIKPKQ